jgi:hypothetical protein
VFVQVSFADAGPGHVLNTASVDLDHSAGQGATSLMPLASCSSRSSVFLNVGDVVEADAVDVLSNRPDKDNVVGERATVIGCLRDEDRAHPPAV